MAIEIPLEEIISGGDDKVRTRCHTLFITEESEEDNIIDVLMLDDYSEWCFQYHEFNYYCKEVKKCP